MRSNHNIDIFLTFTYNHQAIKSVDINCKNYIILYNLTWSIYFSFSSNGVHWIISNSALCVTKYHVYLYLFQFN